jgi:hypothetical protein
MPGVLTELHTQRWDEDTGVGIVVDTARCVSCHREILRADLWRNGKVLRSFTVAARPGKRARAGWLNPEQASFSFEDLRPLPPEAHNLEALKRGRERFGARWRRRT